MNNVNLLNVLENTTDAILVHDGHNPLYFNSNLLTLLEFKDDEEYQNHARQKGILSCIHPQDFERVKASLIERIKGINSENRYYSARIITQKKNVRWVDLKTSSIEWDQKLAGMVCLQDSTEIINQKNSNNNIQRLFEHVLAYVPAVITLTSAKDGVYHHVSDMFELLLGYKKHQVLGKSSYDLNIWPYENERLEIKNLLMSGKKVENFLCSVANKNNEIIPAAIWGKVIHGEPDDLILLVGFDRRDEVDKLEKIQLLNEQLKLIATIDPLTSLKNRRYILEESSKFFRLGDRHNYPISVVICDIDFFKNVNDKYGHDVGDAVIVTFSRILESCIREGDLLARWGGEEFVLVLNNADCLQAKVIAERMRSKAANTLMDNNGENFNFTVSFGVFQLENKQADIEDGIKHADIALYKAKDLGRNRVEIYNS